MNRRTLLKAVLAAPVAALVPVSLTAEDLYKKAFRTTVFNMLKTNPTGWWSAFLKQGEPKWSGARYVIHTPGIASWQYHALICEAKDNNNPWPFPRLLPVGPLSAPVLEKGIDKMMEHMEGSRFFTSWKDIKLEYKPVQIPNTRKLLTPTTHGK